MRKKDLIPAKEYNECRKVVKNLGLQDHYPGIEYFKDSGIMYYGKVNGDDYKIDIVLGYGQTSNVLYFAFHKDYEDSFEFKIKDYEDKRVNTILSYLEDHKDEVSVKFWLKQFLTNEDIRVDGSSI